MATGGDPNGALLVGSVPLDNEEDVFRTAGRILGDRLRRIPDGETGDRTNWIGWQYGVMAQTPALEPVPRTTDDYTDLQLFRIREGVRPEEITFGNLGYADAALHSWETFRRLQTDGAVPRRAKLQVSLPTPLAPVAAFLEPQAQRLAEPAYERALMAELDRILDGIPHDHLAVQWDVAVEFGIMEHAFPSFLWDLSDDELQQAIVDRVVRYAGHVPDDAELGIHLCYGDAGHRHFKEPEDTSLLVQIANALSARITRPIQWIHLPVPRGRDDDAYYAPLENLQLHPETELYLGLVHMTDGAEGAQRRIETAKRHVQHFGVATECGFGRRPAETVPDLMQIHADVCTAVTDAQVKEETA
jgi:hypothetical protein